MILQGARAVGKSTLLEALARAFGREVVDLDDLPTREAVREDPGLFVRGERPVLIDEFQHVPEVLDAIKAELNRDGSAGRFVLTGSTRYTTLPVAAQALTGRAHRVDVLPLSQGEIAGVREDFVEVLLSDPGALVDGGGSDGGIVETAKGVSREEYVARVVAGGFPSVLGRARPSERARWFDDYLELVIERDVMELTRVQQRRQLPLLLSQLAGQTGQVLNIANAARAIGMEKSTAESYTQLLESVFLIWRLPAWGTTLGPRVGAAPKVHLVDSGLAARLLRLTESKLAAASASALTQLGHLLETFVVGEVCKQLAWIDEPVRRGHWRTHDGEEVDLILEREDGGIVALEVKASSRVSARELRSLKRLRGKLGAMFVGGVVMYTGAHAYTADGMQVLPIGCLWRARPGGRAVADRNGMMRQ